MKISAMFLLIYFLCSVTSATTHTSLGGGLSIYTSENDILIKDDKLEWHPGFNLEFIFFGKPEEHIGIGLGVLYTRWSADLAPEVKDSLRIALHYWRVPLLIRGFFPLEEKVSLFLDVGDGVSFGMRKFKNVYGRDKTEGLVDNALLFGGGVLINNFEIKSLFNILFDTSPVKWISFSIGFHY